MPLTGPTLVYRWQGNPSSAQTVKLGDWRVTFTPDPLTLAIETANGEKVQHIQIDRETAIVSFPTGTAPILGLGEGGPQFDRRGNTERMMSGSGGYNLRNFGSRVPIDRKSVV